MVRRTNETVMTLWEVGEGVRALFTQVSGYSPGIILEMPNKFDLQEQFETFSLESCTHHMKSPKWKWKKNERKRMIKALEVKIKSI